MKVPFQINLRKKHVLMLLALMLSAGTVFSYGLKPEVSGINCLWERTPAMIKKTDKDNTHVFSFVLVKSPEKGLLDKSLEKFRQIEGFVSLAVKAGNEVEVITAKHISEKDNAHVLMISARLYGYIGYQIIQ